MSAARACHQLFRSGCQGKEGLVAEGAGGRGWHARRVIGNKPASPVVNQGLPRARRDSSRDALSRSKHSRGALAKGCSRSLLFRNQQLPRPRSPNPI